MNETAATTNDLFGLYSQGLAGIMAHRDGKPMEVAMRMMRTMAAAILMTVGSGAMAAGSAWTKVRCAAESSFLINAKGDLYATGHRSAGNLGDRRRSAFPLFTTKWRKTLTKVADVSSIGLHTIALRQNGTAWLAGINKHGEIGRPVLNERNPVWKRAKLPSRAKVTGVSAGGVSSFVVTADGALWVTGASELGTQSLPSDTFKFSTKWQKTLGDVVAARLTAGDSYAWRKDGSMWRIDVLSSAKEDFLPSQITVNIPGVPTPTTFDLPTLTPTGWQPMTLVNGIVDALDTSTPRLLTATGDVYWYKDNNNDSIPDDQVDSDGVRTPAPSTDYLIGSGFAAVDLHALGFFGLTTGGQLQQWIPRHDDPITRLPVQAHWEPALDGVRSFCVGAKHALAIRTDGTVWAAGGNESGQFGNGTTVGTASPKDWVQILQ